MDPDDPKLTHVVVDKRDVSRRITLMQRASQGVIFHRLPKLMLSQA